MKTKIIIAGIVTIMLLAVTFKLKSNKRIVEENIYRPDLEKQVLVEAQSVVLKSAEKSLRYTGTFAAFREVMLTPQVHGEVEYVYFDEGDHVYAGKTLVQMNDDLLKAQYIGAEASYETAKRNLERYEKASGSGGVSKIQLDNFSLTLKSAESTITQLLKQIELSKIIAPFTGTITLRDVEPGAVVGGTPVARITDLTKLKLEVFVPENEAILFKEGKVATVTTDVYPGHTFTGIIDYVADRADNSHNYMVRILIENNLADKMLKAGMYGTVALTTGLGKDALYIPRTALLGSAKNPQVFIIKDHKAFLKDIQTGPSDNESVEVLSGLQAGEMVVVSGHINLSSGSNVAISK